MFVFSPNSYVGTQSPKRWRKDVEALSNEEAVGVEPRMRPRLVRQALDVINCQSEKKIKLHKLNCFFFSLILPELSQFGWQVLRGSHSPTARRRLWLVRTSKDEPMAESNYGTTESTSTLQIPQIWEIHAGRIF